MHRFSHALVSLKDRPAVAFFMRGSEKFQTRVTETGSVIVYGVPIFRAGTFKDSLGRQRTWTVDDLSQMVANFETLRTSQVFPNVPVRRDHSGSVESVVGYFAGLRVSGALLLADLEFTDAEAFHKWDNGTYRSRSAEIGAYETNDEVVFYPTVTGVAFVDIPAVEGLDHAYSKGGPTDRLIIDEKESADVDEETWIAAATYAQALVDWERAANYAKALEDWERAATYADALIQLDAVPRAAAHSRGGEPATFRVAGADVVDVAAVQRHIDVLESFQRETMDGNRRNFVKGLVDAHKIAAPQAESMTELALGMSPEQFEQFRASYEAAPVIRLFEQFGDPTNPAGEGDSSKELDVLRATVAEFTKSGMTEDEIKSTTTYKRLTALESQAS